MLPTLSSKNTHAPENVLFYLLIYFIFFGGILAGAKIQCVPFKIWHTVFCSCWWSANWSVIALTQAHPHSKARQYSTNLFIKKSRTTKQANNSVKVEDFYKQLSTPPFNFSLPMCLMVICPQRPPQCQSTNKSCKDKSMQTFCCRCSHVNICKLGLWLYSRVTTC